MLRFVIYLAAVAAAVAMLPPAPAVAEDLGEIARDIRRSERLISAALLTGDREEIAAQRRKLLGNYRRISDTSTAGDVRALACAQANQALLNALLDLEKMPARGLVAIQDEASEYTKFMSACEGVRRHGRR